MPLINVKLIEDVFTPEQKRQIVEKLTDAMVAIEGARQHASWAPPTSTSPRARPDPPPNGRGLEPRSGARPAGRRPAR